MSRNNRLLSHRNLGFAAGIAVAAVAVLWFVYGGRGTVETENAYVKADKLSLSADVAGRIVEVRVRRNQRVERGQVLVRLDDTPYRLAVEEAQARLAQVRNEILARQADYAEAEAKLEKARSDADFYQRQLARNEHMGPVAVSEAQLDEARQQLSEARAEIAINAQKLSRLGAALGGDPSLPPEQQADVQVAQARLDSALYKLSRTVLYAPVDGTVANEIPQVGEMAPAGLTLISMVSLETVWVDANLKETRLAGIRPGQSAVVVVDAYPERRWKAHVESLSPASGSEFALIPAQNASGNWVKVVQRIPVHLSLELDGTEHPLRAGMSARVWIDIDSDADEELVAAGGDHSPGGAVAVAGQ